MFLALFVFSGSVLFICAASVVLVLNLLINMPFIKALVSAGGLPFATGAVLYYTALYPLAVGTGGLLGMLRRA